MNVSSQNLRSCFQRSLTFGTQIMERGWAQSVHYWMSLDVERFSCSMRTEKSWFSIDGRYQFVSVPLTRVQAKKSAKHIHTHKHSQIFGSRAEERWRRRWHIQKWAIKWELLKSIHLFISLHECVVRKFINPLHRSMCVCDDLSTRPILWLVGPHSKSVSKSKSERKRPVNSSSEEVWTLLIWPTNTTDSLADKSH